MSAISLAALTVGLLCGLAPLAQAARIWTKRSSEDVSIVWLSLYACGAAVWLVYGLDRSSVPLVLSQSVALLCVAVALGLAVRARHPVRRHHPGRPGSPHHASRGSGSWRGRETVRRNQPRRRVSR